MKKFLIVILFFNTISFSQDYGNKANALELCVFLQEASSNYLSSRQAQEIVNKIVSVYGGDINFLVHPCNNINNAAAITYKGIRYILYDPVFMNSITSNNKDSYWVNMSILAHEIGHFIKGHTVDLALYFNEDTSPEPKTLETKRRHELEADEFSGFVLNKLGASVDQATYAMDILGFDGDDLYSTHPTRTKRLSAIKKGYYNINYYNDLQYQETPFLKHLYDGKRKYDKGDFLASIDASTKAISINQRFPQAYFNRAQAKFEIGKFQEAITDYNTAIRLKEDPLYYNERGVTFEKIGRYREALEDYNKAISVNKNYINAYFNRGAYFGNFENDWEKAKSDFEKCVEINDKDVEAYFALANSKYKIYIRDISYMNDAEKFTLLMDITNDLEIALDLPENYVFKTEVLEDDFKAIALKTLTNAYLSHADFFSAINYVEDFIDIINNKEMNFNWPGLSTNFNNEMIWAYMMKAVANHMGDYGMIDSSRACDDLSKANSIFEKHKQDIDQNNIQFLKQLKEEINCKNLIKEGTYAYFFNEAMDSYRISQDPKKALKSINKAFEINPTAEAFLYRGILKFELKKPHCYDLNNAYKMFLNDEYAVQKTLIPLGIDLPALRIRIENDFKCNLK